jgi:RHS repeat-associated protein
VIHSYIGSPLDLPSGLGGSIDGYAQNTSYDAYGDVLVQQDPGSTTLYLPGEQLTAAGSTVSGARVIALPSGGDVVRTGATTSYSFEIPDIRGTSTLYLDNTAQTPAWRQFTPYGAPRGAPVTWVDNRGYLGKPADPATGLTILGARQYDPVTGQFISPDPLLAPGDPQNLDAYAYSEDNPVVRTDPTGLTSCDQWGNCTATNTPVTVTSPSLGGPSYQTPAPAPASGGCGFLGMGCAWHAVTGGGSWAVHQGTDLVGGIGNGIADFATSFPSMLAELYNQMFDAFPTGVTAGGQLEFGNHSNISVPHSPWHVGNPRSILYKAGYYGWPLLFPPAAAEDAGAGTLGDARAGQTVFRVWGRDPASPDLAPNQSGPWGRSWTRVDPGSVAKYRDVAGLPDEANLGRFVSQGTPLNPTGVEVREALQLGTNQGGLDELLIPNPESQIELNGVFGVNPPF